MGINFADPQRVRAANLHAVPTQVAFPGSFGTLNLHEHHAFRALWDAGLAQVALGIIHIIGAFFVLLDGSGWANFCAVTALRTNL